MRGAGADLPAYSTVPGIVWPAIPPDVGQALLALQFQFDRSQWWTAEVLQTRQFRQLRLLIAHAVAEVPHYRDHLARAGVSSPDDIAPETFLRWPLLDKRAIQADMAGFQAKEMPAGHGHTSVVTTSGSSGEPLRATTSDATSFVQAALVMRSHLWYGFDLRKKLCIIRTPASPGNFPDWGPPANTAFRTGPSALLLSLEGQREQLDWLCDQRPAYLLVNSSNLWALLKESRRGERSPQGLRSIMAFGDALPLGTRQLAHELWQASLFDIYSASECGAIAFQCPQTQLLHVQGEHVYLEILLEDGKPCAPGESGRVVVTDLHNFAMPLIRYDLGDYAVRAGACPCGRGLPTLEGILGRSTHMAVDPTGRTFFGRLNQAFWTTVAPIIQRQVVQHTPSRLEVRYVADRPLTPAEEAAIAREMRLAMRYAYEIEFTRTAEIARNAGGKFDDFLSLLPGIVRPE